MNGFFSSNILYYNDFDDERHFRKHISMEKLLITTKKQ